MNEKSLSLKAGDFWWTRDKLVIETLINHNSSFRFWLDEKIILFDKLRAKNEVYYQELSYYQLINDFE